MKHKALIFGGIGLLVAAVGIAVSLYLLSQPQDTRQQAAVENGTARVKITPATATLAAGESTTATVALSTEGEDIDGVSIQLEFPFSGSTSPITISNIALVPALEDSGRFNCDLSSYVDTTSPAVIEFGCITMNGYSNTTFADLFSFTITAGTNAVAASIPIKFNATNTIVAANGQDVAAIPTGQLAVTLPVAEEEPNEMDVSYTASCEPNELEVSVILTDGDGEPLTNTNVEFALNAQEAEKRTDADGEATVVFAYVAASSYELTINADGYAEVNEDVDITACPAPEEEDDNDNVYVVPVSCNGSCTSSSDCQTGLSCYAGQCRSPQCQSDSTCQCDTSDVASISGTTQLPTTGSLDRVLALMLIGGLLTLGGVQVLYGLGSQTNGESEK